MDVLGVLSGFIHFLVFLALGRLLLEATQTHRDSLRFQKWLFTVALTVRFGVSLVIYNGGGVEVIRDEDASGWVRGEGLKKAWEEQGYSLLHTPVLFLESYEGHHSGYYYLLGVFFTITGAPGRMAAATLNCFLGALTIVFVYRLARSLFSEPIACRAGWLACLFPSLILWSAQTLKEPVVIFLETLALYACTELRRSGFTVRHILTVCLAGLLLYPFRFYACYVILGTLLLSLLLPRIGWDKSQFSSFAVVALALAVALYFSRGLLLKEMETNTFDLRYVEKMRDYSAKNTGSGVKVETDLETPVGFGVATIVGAAHLLFAPFPWQWGGSLRMALVIPEVVLWWCLIAYAVIPGMWYGIRQRWTDLFPLLLFIVSLGFICSLTFNNVGLIYRQRAQFLPWLLIFAAVGIELRNAWKTGEPADLEPAVEGALEPVLESVS